MVPWRGLTPYPPCYRCYSSDQQPFILYLQGTIFWKPFQVSAFGAKAREPIFPSSLPSPWQCVIPAPCPYVTPWCGWDYHSNSTHSVTPPIAIELWLSLKVLLSFCLSARCCPAICSYLSSAHKPAGKPQWGHFWYFHIHSSGWNLCRWSWVVDHLHKSAAQKPAGSSAIL